MALYIVSLVPNPGVGPLDVQGLLDRAHSWYRFSNMNWVVCTHESAETWTTRLRQFADPQGTLFICRLDPVDRQGWMPKDFWQWIRDHRWN